MSFEKSTHNVSEFEVDSQDLHYQSKVRSLSLIDSARVGLTALALLMGLTILGVAGDTLQVYNSTSVSSDILALSLWPAEFNLQPTVALVAGSAILVVANAVSLVFSKVKVLRNKAGIHNALTFASPSIGLLLALIAMIYFYAVNASDSSDTLLSWTCRWTAVSMNQKPHWSTLCHESRAGVYLSIVLVPVEAAVVAIAAYELKVERYLAAYSAARKGSPVLH